MLWVLAKGATWILLLICISAQTSATAGCDNDGPRRCAFNGTGSPALCGWSLGGDFVHTTSFGGELQLVRGSDTGNLTSRTTCSTGGQPHCLRFAFRFDENNTINLTVSIRHGLADKPEELLWILSSSGKGWTEASVLITVNYSFSVIFKATRLCGQTASKGSVRIDEIRYDKSNPCTLQPPNASPTWVPATPNPCNNTVSSPATTMMTTTSEETAIKSTTHDNLNTTTSDGRGQRTDTTKADTLSPISEDAEDVSEPSDNTGVIVGGVLAGVAVIVTATLVVLVRRKRLDFGKPCFEIKQREQRSQDDDGYEIPLPRMDRGNNTDMASGRENEGARETVSGTDLIEHSGDHALTQPNERVHVPLPTVSNNYDCLDFTNSDQDRRVYVSFNDGSDHHNAPSQPGLYEALGERRDSHIYGHTPETSLFQD